MIDIESRMLIKMMIIPMMIFTSGIGLEIGGNGERKEI